MLGEDDTAAIGCVPGGDPPAKARRVIVLMDTTYWGRNLCLMLFKDAITNRNLLRYYVRSETVQDYIRGVEELTRRGFEIVAIVCDGRRGLTQAFGGIPVQMCMFHQRAIIRRYLTLKPKLEASQALVKIVDGMKNADRASFLAALARWEAQWSSFIEERSIDRNTGEGYYTHKRLRSAYRSLKNNAKWLFTWCDTPGLGIPTTTNALEGLFGGLKTKLRNHNGLSLKRKMKFIDSLLGL